MAEPPADKKTESQLSLLPGARVALAITSRQGTTHLELPPSTVIRVGRSDECEVRLRDDPSVSRVHAILRVGEPLSIEDNGSRHGTRVSGRTLAAGERAVLMHGASVQLGETTLVVCGLSRVPAREAGAVVIDPAMRRIHDELLEVANSDIPVLLLGETGTGKEVLARALHDRSRRASERLYTLNCAALPESILEGELFGYERGAFTGAQTSRPGVFEAADNGTLFLDEVGELPLGTQAKLLRVLELGELTRLGSRETRRVDVRFVAATNRDLPALVRAERFRSDLYYRLNGHVIRVPALRERPSEIAHLAELFLARAAERAGASTLRLRPSAVAALERHAWPGNVRELKNVVERAVALNRTKTELGPEDLRLDADPRHAPSAPTIPPAVPLRDSVHAAERKRIMEALSETDGNQTEAARVLGISRRALVYKLDEYGIDRPRKKGPPKARRSDKR